MYRGVGLVLVVLLAGCKPTPRPIPPSPSPSPLPTPTPWPSSTPPTPSPSIPPPDPPALCGLPVEQDRFVCQPGVPTLARNVRVAILGVMLDAPERFEVAEDGQAWLLKADGTRARHEEPGSPEARAWFVAAVVLKLQEDGMCAGSFGSDEVVLAATSAGPFQTYDVVNDGGGNVRKDPPGYGNDCVPQED